MADERETRNVAGNKPFPVSSPYSSPSSFPSLSANVSLFRVSPKVCWCNALTLESRFANIRENDGRREDYAGMKRLSPRFEELRRLVNASRPKGNRITR